MYFHRKMHLRIVERLVQLERERTMLVLDPALCASTWNTNIRFCILNYFMGSKIFLSFERLETVQGSEGSVR